MKNISNFNQGLMFIVLIILFVTIWALSDVKPTIDDFEKVEVVFIPADRINTNVSFKFSDDTLGSGDISCKSKAENQFDMDIELVKCRFNAVMMMELVTAEELVNNVNFRRVFIDENEYFNLHSFSYFDENNVIQSETF